MTEITKLEYIKKKFHDVSNTVLVKHKDQWIDDVFNEAVWEVKNEIKQWILENEEDDLDHEANTLYVQSIKLQKFINELK